MTSMLWYQDVHVYYRNASSTYITTPPLLHILSDLRVAPLFTNTNARSSRLENILEGVTGGYEGMQMEAFNESMEAKGI